ncbi:MAG: PadR family transcriptional regulator [Candidatus Aenigmatarchaeota archaeon]
MVLEKHKKFTFPLIFMSFPQVTQKYPVILPTENYGDVARQYRRRWIRSCIDFLILYFLEHYGNLHGYKIMKKLREKFGYNPGASTVYPTLWSLEERGLVESQMIIAEKPRRVYSITKKGRWHFRVGVSELKALVRKINVKSSIQNWYKKYLRKVSD